jgi:hypothetical protein
MKTVIVVTVTAPDDTQGVTDAIAYALDWPDHYPDEVDTSDWDVQVSEVLGDDAGENDPPG